MKPNWKVTFFVLFSLAVVRIFYSNHSQITPEDKTFALNNSLAEVVSEMNKDLPKMMNKYLRIDSVTSGDTSIITHFTTVNLLVSDFKEGYKEVFKEMAMELACNPEAKQIFELGISPAYSFHDNDSDLIATFVISPEDCR